MTIRFSEAVEALKSGKKVARYTWNEPGLMYLYLVQGSQFQVSREPLISHLPEGAVISYQAHIDALYEYPTGKFARVYNFTMEDIMSDSWRIVENG